MVALNVDEMFEEFYELYPKKVNRKNALKSYKRAVKGHRAHEDIMDALSDQIDGNAFSSNKQFICAPSVWLNGERWKNEVIDVRDDDEKGKRHNSSKSAYMEVADAIRARSGQTYNDPSY